MSRSVAPFPPEVLTLLEAHGFDPENVESLEVRERLNHPIELVSVEMKGRVEHRLMRGGLDG